MLVAEESLEEVEDVEGFEGFEALEGLGGLEGLEEVEGLEGLGRIVARISVWDGESRISGEMAMGTRVGDGGGRSGAVGGWSMDSQV